MCSHYAYRRKELNRLADLANFERLGREIADRYNISPTQTTIVLRQDADGAAELVPMRWGLVPAWSEEIPRRAPLINAKAETAHKLPSFRSAFKARRCVLPATAYYEFPGTRAFAIRPTDEEPILFAGLWEEWRGGETPLLSCTMLTCEPNERLAEVHHRMPVVLTPEGARLWLTGDPAGNALLGPCAADRLDFYPVSRDAGNWRNDAAYLLEPVASE